MNEKRYIAFELPIDPDSDRFWALIQTIERYLEEIEEQEAELEAEQLELDFEDEMEFGEEGQFFCELEREIVKSHFTNRDPS